MEKITLLVMRTPRRATILFFAFLVLFGGAFWVAMKWAARRAGSPPPASAVWGVPDRPLRFVSYNIRHGERGLPRIIDEIRKLEPDFVLLQEVEREHLSTMTRELRSMPAVYHASENLAGPRASWGNAILSRHRLYEGQSIPNPDGGASFGVWATAAIDGKKFRVACVHLSDNKELTNLVKAWEDAGRRPIVLGGEFGQVANDNSSWSDALKGLGKDKGPRVDHLLVSKDWAVI